jgi:hypothetical protein
MESSSSEWNDRLNKANIGLNYGNAYGSEMRRAVFGAGNDDNRLRTTRRTKACKRGRHHLPTRHPCGRPLGSTGL